MRYFKIPEPYRGLLSIFLIILVALGISFSIRVFFVQSFSVDGESMQPSYHNGDYLLVDKFSYKISSPSRGDVVVLKYPEDPSQVHIKRIVGLPNETVIIEDGVVKIKQPNSDATITLNEPYISATQQTEPFYTVSSFPLGNDEYFVLGDNRTNSTDSRAYYDETPTPLYRDLIVGKVLVRLWPLSDISFASTPQYPLE